MNFEQETEEGNSLFANGHHTHRQASGMPVGEVKAVGINNQASRLSGNGDRLAVLSIEACRPCERNIGVRGLSRSLVRSFVRSLARGAATR